jgi:hypothetical protein
MLTEEQKNDDLVKSLIAGGFDEEVIAGWLDSGAITIEKSTQYGPDDHGEGDGDGDDEKRKDKGTKKRKEEDEEEEDFEKGCNKKGKIEKSLSDDLLKSVESLFSEQMSGISSDIVKSLSGALEAALEPIVDKIEKSINAMREAVVQFGNQAPSFKGANLNQAVIEKSVAQGGGVKDENNKVSLSVSRDRAVVRQLIIKSIEEEQDAEIQKSLRENTTAYLLDELEGAIGESAAMYLYTKKGVRLVK